MHLRETTRSDSPLVIERVFVGQRLPMLLSATGRAYLAFCPEAERDLILLALARSGDASNALAGEPKAVNRLLAQTRRKGYGERLGELEKSTGSIAIPIFFRERVLACINVAFFAKTMRPDEAAERYLSAMRAAARRIEQGLGIGEPTCASS